MYSYDTLNRLSKLAPPAAFGSGSFGFGYDALSRRTQMMRPNGVATNYTYDNLSRLLSVLHQVNGATIDGASYTVDAAGNRTSKTDQRTSVTTNYGYDAIYQLLSATGSTPENYTYDAVGNRLTSAAVASYSCNASNEVTGDSNGSYAYDADGNTLTDAAGRTYTWDFENRLTKVITSGGLTVSFRYDPFGRRIYVSTPSGTTIYVYDGDNIAEELSGTGVLQERYTYEPGIDEPLVGQRQPKIFYYEADGLGSVTSLTDPTGALAATYTYNSFGFLTNSTGSATNWFRYTARQFDSNTALYYYRARYYDPVSGRFLSEDPTRFNAGVNFYTYVQNNPTNLSDPTGLCGAGKGQPQSPCTNATLAAAGVKAQEQIAMAQGLIAAGKAGADASQFSNPLFEFFGGMFGYYEAVHTGGPNDIKNQPGPGYHNQTGVDAGNISFGITCPYGSGFCQFAAGLAQTLTGHPNFSGTLATGFDTPSDNATIQEGQAMRAAGCHE